MDHPSFKEEGNELPFKYQQFLTDKGHQILEEILKDNSDPKMQALPLIEEIPEEIKQKTAFNPLGEYAPSSFLRWYFGKEKPHVQEYLAKIICLCWALNDLAVQQKECFTRGSFTLIDPNKRIFHFLKGYVCLVNNYTLMDFKPWVLTTSNLAYRRDPESNGSSHHTDQTEGSQFGIDIRFRSYETLYGLLPHLMRHILFGRLNLVTTSQSRNLPLTFIKFEPVGLGSSTEILTHITNFAAPVTSIEGKRREKDIPDEVWDVFVKLTQDKSFDEKKIYKMLDHYHFRNHPEDLKKMQFILKKFFPNDTKELLDIRTGSEVILDLRIIEKKIKSKIKKS